MQQRGEDQVLDTSLLGSICDVLALGNLDIILGSLPVVGDQEDGVGTLDSLSDRRLAV
jgi:hypothetical protein